MVRATNRNELKTRNWFSVLRYLLAIIFVFVVVQIALISFFDFNLAEWRYYPTAQVGTTAAVPPNEFNKLARQLQEKEIDLSAREEVLKKQESTFASDGVGTKNNTLFYLYVVLAILLALITTNYYLDYRRRRSGDT